MAIEYLLGVSCYAAQLYLSHFSLTQILGTIIRSILQIK